MRVTKTQDREHAAKIEARLHENGGYCPCRIEKTEENKCMCLSFREQIARGEAGKCHCGLYIIHTD